MLFKIEWSSFLGALSVVLGMGCQFGGTPFEMELSTQEEMNSVEDQFTSLTPSSIPTFFLLY